MRPKSHTFTRWLGVIGLAFHFHLAATALSDEPKAAATQSEPVTRETVAGSIHHGDGHEKFQRLTGKVEVIDARTLRFGDGTKVTLLTVTPDLEQMAMQGETFYPAGREAADFLRKLIADRPVQCYLVSAQDKWRAYVGDQNIVDALLLNGWALAQHSGEHPTEIIARDHQRGLWRGRFIDPEDWRAGQRLPGEPKSQPQPAAAPVSTAAKTAPTEGPAKIQPGRLLASGLVHSEEAVPTRGNWGGWLRYFRGDTHGAIDMVVLSVTLVPGAAPHPPHRHAEEEFMILTEGSGTWHLDGKDLPARKGDVLYAAPWAMHGIRNTGDAPLTYSMFKWSGKGVDAPPAPAATSSPAGKK
jgi:mannose-6-phosphate isomerase-like protein (cupin superfamily)/endonuclease YncB( thermonuclease family)